MKKKIKTHNNGKARIELEDKSMASSWFRDKDSLLRHIGKLVLLHGDTWTGYINWRFVK